MTKTNTAALAEAAPAPTGSMQADIEAALATVPYRQPIVDDYVERIYARRPDETVHETAGRVDAYQASRRLEGKAIDREWLAITEIARQAIINSPDVRRSLAEFTSMPLSEGLPRLALDELVREDERAARLTEATSETLGTILDLEEIPDDLIVPDITKAPFLKRPIDEKKLLVHWYLKGPEEFATAIELIRDKVEDRPGITHAERELIARRYRYARDVKLLGLMAELSDQPIRSHIIKDGVATHTLKSGTKLAITAEAIGSAPGILDPTNWQSRRQLKDRVYTVRVGGRHYMLKERKTARHTDTKEKGHKEGLTAQQEFETAREFAALGTIDQGDVSLRWEKPLGYVEFPDGYQFCLFEREPNLRTDEPIAALGKEILGSAEQYREEFETVSRRAREIYNERPDLLIDAAIGEKTPVKPKRLALSRAARSHKKAYNASPKPDELTFEEFAELKVKYLLMEAQELLKQTMLDKGYTNSDVDGHAYRVRQGDRPKLEIIGFDFEYYANSPEGAKRIQQNIARHDQSGETATMWAYRSADRRIQTAASYAMVEGLGFPLPPPREE